MTDALARWLRVAVRPNVVKRSLRVGLTVGTILTAVNQGGSLLAGLLTASIAWKIALTYCVPFCVSTFVSVQVILEREP